MYVFAFTIHSPLVELQKIAAKWIFPSLSVQLTLIKNWMRIKLQCNIETKVIEVK